MHDLITIFWFLLPAGMANMAPIIFNRLPLLNVPVDFGRQWRGKPIFGPHKTYRGFFVGVVLAIGFVYLQKWLAPHIGSYNLVNYQTINLIGLGFLLGFGALTGDLLKSFAKRRVGRRSGQSWVPFDQIDWVVGALVASSLVANFTLQQVLLALIVFCLLHPVSNLVGYALKFKPNKF